MTLSVRPDFAEAPIELDRIARRSGASTPMVVFKRAFILAACLAAVSTGMMFAGWQRDLCVQAAAIVWLTGAIGLVVAHWPVRTMNVVALMLGAMLLRMSGPLAAMAWLSGSASGSASSSGRELSGLIVVHYLAALAVETVMIVRLIQERELGGSRASSSTV